MRVLRAMMLMNQTMKKQGKNIYFLLLLAVMVYSDHPGYGHSNDHTLQETDSFQLQQHLKYLKTGDYAVFSQGSKKTFIMVKHASPENIFLEEISYACLLPQDRIEPGTSWKEHILTISSTPENISLFHIHRNGIDTYSFHPRKSMLKPSCHDSPTASLLTTSFIPLEKHLLPRNKTSSLPWSPKVTVEGNAREIPAQAFRGMISKYPVLIYFIDPSISIFPIWMSIQSPTGNTVIHTIDVGSGATSPYQYDLPSH